MRPRHRMDVSGIAPAAGEEFRPWSRMIRRMGWGLFLLAVVLAVIGLLLTAATVALMGWSLLRPPRMTDGKAAWLLQRLSPGDLNMPYEDARFTVRDERTGQPLRVAAWWIP